MTDISASIVDSHMAAISAIKTRLTVLAAAVEASFTASTAHGVVSDAIGHLGKTSISGIEGVVSRGTGSHSTATLDLDTVDRYDGVRLVAVSKTKPEAAVLAVYAAGQRHFGENYVQELIGKAATLPRDIAWHFIGQLQSNKAKVLVHEVPNLYAVESVDSVKLANLLQKACETMSPGRPAPLNVFVQVNTSGEEQKGGVSPGDEAVALAVHIATKCPLLALKGLMTIGKVDESADVFFTRLVDERVRVCAALGLELSALELSMGMSGDFERAITLGSTNVRVGSSIFGARDYSRTSKPSSATAHAATTLA